MTSTRLFIAAAAFSAALAITGSAQANGTANTGFATSTDMRFEMPSTLNKGSITHTVPRGKAVKNRFINGSDTANFYYSVGVKSFENGDHAKAERAFKAVLRANGSRKEAHHYLALISGEKGDSAAVAKHVQAFQAAR